MSRSPDSVVVLVLGMHRSGTSALARVLNVLGVELGDKLLRPSGDNEAGFWEHRDLVVLHDRLLAAVGSTWDDPRPVREGALLSDATKPVRDDMLAVLRRDFAGRPLWGVKDPRLCRLLPLWLSLLDELGAEPRFVLTARDPHEVAASLAKRDGMSLEQARLLWLEHCLAAERDTRGRRRSFVTYDGLLSDWRPEMVRVGRDLGFDWRDTVAKVSAEVDGFLEPGLRHHRAEDGTGDDLHPWLRAAWMLWRDAAAGGDPGPALAAIRDRFESSGRLFWPWADRLRQEHVRLAAALRERDAKIATLRVRGTASPSPSEPPAAAPTAGTPASVETNARLTRRPGTTVARTYEQPEGHPRVSIIVPLFNRVDLTARCLESISEHSEPGLYEVVLVDNGSTDGTAELLRCLEGNVKVVVNERNLGFATACNQGAEMAATDNLLFLNNDVEAKPGWLAPLLALFDADPGVAAVGSRLLFPNGTIQHAGVALLHDPAAPVPLRAFHMHYGQAADFPDANTRSEVQVLTAACLLVRRGVFESVGGFDTHYWNGCEDVDLCLKIGAKGWTLVYEPRSCLVHHESQSGAERYTRVAGNEQLLCARWLGKVDPDVIETDGSRRRTEARRIRAYALPQSTDPARAARAAAGDDELVSIVVVTRNQLEHTRLCYESLRRHTPEPHEIVFVDNGSTDGTVDWLRDVVRDYPHARAVIKSENLGYAGGNNQGLALTRGRQIVLLNNDTVVTEGWLGGLMAVLEEHPSVGLVGPVTNHVSGPQVIEGVTYRTLPEMERFAREHGCAHRGESEPARRLVGFCLLVRREVIDAIGGLDERFGNGNCEDDDWCLRAYQAGWEARIAHGVFVHHTGGRTFAGEGIDYAESLRENFERFKVKWGMHPGARAENGYPFLELARGPRQPSIPLPAIAGRHEATIGGRWIEDPARSEPATGQARLRVGVLPGGEPDASVRELFARYGHQGPLPVVATSATLATWLDAPGLVLLLGPDVAVSAGALEELTSVCSANPRLAAVGPVAGVAPGPQQTASGAITRREAPRFAEKRRRRYRGRWHEVPYLGGFCLLLRSEKTQAVGGIDATLPLADALFDLFARLRGAGHPLAVAAGSWVHHRSLGEEEGAGYDAAWTAGAGAPATGPE
jgi:GT2 family glycosyltransferase